MEKLRISSSIFVLALCASTSLAGDLIDLGILNSGTYSRAFAVNFDGSLVVGDGNSSGVTVPLYWLNASNVPQILSPGFAGSARAVSAESDVIAGWLYDSQSRVQATGWGAPSWPSSFDLGNLPSLLRDTAAGVSGNGSAIVGLASGSGSDDRGFVWTSLSGMVALPAGVQNGATSASAISVNGAVVVGHAVFSGGSRAASWTNSGNWSVHPVDGSANGSDALGVSGDGAVIVGTSSNRPFRSEGSNFAHLGTNSGVANGVAGDGNVIVGFMTVGSANHAFVWTPDHDVVDLDQLAGKPSGWTLTSANAVSANGRVIVGTGKYNNVDRAWLWAAFQYPSVSPLLVEGEEYEGDASSIASSDDAYFQAFNDATTLTCRIEFSGQSVVKPIVQLRFRCEAGVARGGLAQTIHLYDYSTQSWVTGSGTVASVSDSVVDSVRTGTQANNCVDSSGNVKARITWNPLNDENPSQDGWLHRVDLAEWRLL